MTLEQTVREVASILTPAVKEAEDKASRDIFGTAMVSASGATVKLDGAEGFAPCTCMVGVHHGDRVMAHVVNHRIVVFANITAPTTDDATALVAIDRADAATEAADAAGIAAASAQADATAAKADAATAKGAAERAIEDAATAQAAAEAVQGLAQQAAQDAADASTAAGNAATAAGNAMQSASQANTYAINALGSLSEVEQVVGTLNWIAEHGDYSQSIDKTADPARIYYERAGSGTTADPYVYEQVDEVAGYIPTEDTAIDESKTYYVYDAVEDAYVVVAEPDVEDIGSYYEFTESPAALGLYVLVVDDSVQNYIATHLALTDDGLQVVSDDSKYRLKLTAQGMEVLAPDGTPVGIHGEVVQLGQESDIHMRLTSTRLAFRTSAGDIAYFGLNEDNIWQMHVATTYVDDMIRFGDYAWIKRDNGNMSIKWLGA